MKNKPQETKSGRTILRLRREVRRLRNTAAFRIGLHLTNTVRNPLLLIILPITFPVYCIYLGLERLGKFAIPKHPEYPEMEIFEPKECAVFFPTNGVGFGHFTRLFAVAKQMRKKILMWRSYFLLQCQHYTYLIQKISLHITYQVGISIWTWIQEHGICWLKKC